MSRKRRKKRPKGDLRNMARMGFQGFPMATIAYYGPDDRVASKVAVGIILRKDGEVASLERWLSQTVDVRVEPSINQQIAEFLNSHGVKSVALADRIVGCPHEEGIDYPEGQPCPQCPYWANRDRWTGEPTSP